MSPANAKSRKMARSGRSEAETGLRRLREAIDAIDADLLALLNRRAAASLEVGRLKAETGAPIFRPGREEALLGRLLAANSGPLQEEHIRGIYREILSASRALQRPLRVAFLGPEGTFSHMACLEHFSSGVTCMPVAHLADIFQAVENGACELGVVPLENAVHGTVVQSLDLFAGHEVFVLAERISRIHLSLMARASSLAGIRVVYSHAQPLGQCASWLRLNLPQARQISLESTAAAAHRAAREKDSAAVAHAGLAGSLGLAVLASNIEDIPDNSTRFLVIGPTLVVEPGADKSSLLFAIADKPGSLATVLRILADAGINLSKLESRPMRGERWKYLFFADLDCDITAKAPALQAMRDCCLRLRVLGVYPAAGRPAALGLEKR
ncbi:MAG: prephenate dehydratase [Deltaproteobacteria bacterium]|jgi:chorismate mutase/prephenate dehydratase|nr:prephenate dehydratase [Deltaproteobacteria bacterium]